MIILGMKPSEMAKEAVSDLKRLQTWFNDQSPGAYRWAKQQAKKTPLPFWWSKEWKSPNGNLWRVMWGFETAKPLNGPIIQYTIIEGMCGKYLLRPQVTAEGFILMIYLPHFFKRYRQRMSFGDKLRTEQLMRRYLRNNTSATNTGEETNIELTSKEGIGLGTFVFANIMLMKTFITYDMSKGSQVERFNEGLDETKNLGSISKSMQEVMSEMTALGVEIKDFKAKMEAKMEEVIKEKEKELNNNKE